MPGAVTGCPWAPIPFLPDEQVPQQVALAGGAMFRRLTSRVHLNTSWARRLHKVAACYLYIR